MGALSMRPELMQKTDSDSVHILFYFWCKPKIHTQSIMALSMCYSMRSFVVRASFVLSNSSDRSQWQWLSQSCPCQWPRFSWCSCSQKILFTRFISEWVGQGFACGPALADVPTHSGWSCGAHFCSLISVPIVYPSGYSTKIDRVQPRIRNFEWGKLSITIKLSHTVLKHTYNIKLG